MAMDHEAKGMEFMAEAEQKHTGVSRGKVEEARDLYVKAANAFKIAKKWSLAGDAFSKAAELEMGGNRLHQAGFYYAEASKCYKKENTEKSIQCLLKAIETYTDMGRKRMAAQHHQTLAGLYEEENIQKAIEHYAMAAELFRADESASSENKCLLGVAKFSALKDDYIKAIEIYEKIANSSLESSLLRYTATDLFLRAALCHMCSDAHGVASVADNYAQLSPAFSDSRECAFIRKVAPMVVEKDVDAFNEAIKSHEGTSSLRPWHKDMIKKIQKQIDDTPDLR